MKIEEFNCFFYTLASLLLSMMYHEFKNYKQDYEMYNIDIDLYNAISNLLLTIISISALLFGKFF